MIKPQYTNPRVPALGDATALASKYKPKRPPAKASGKKRTGSGYGK